jgi:hypothetical protein
MPFSLRALFVCIPFLELKVNNAQQNGARQWVADFTPDPGATAYVNIDARTTIGTEVDWQVAIWNVNAPAGTPVTGKNPADPYQYQIPLDQPANVVPDGDFIRVTAIVPKLLPVSVDIVVKPLVTGLNVEQNHYAFQEAGGGWYGINLAGIVPNPITRTCNLKVVTNPANAAAWSHVRWAAVDTAAGGAPYALTPIGADNRRKGIPLDGLRTIQTTVILPGSRKVMPAPVVVDIRPPAVSATLANGLGVELHQFTFAGAGWFAVTQEDTIYLNRPYGALWNRANTSRPQAYAASSTITMNAVTLRVKVSPAGGPTNLTVRASAYFTRANDVLIRPPLQATRATANPIPPGTPANTPIPLGDIALGNVPNEVMHNNPLLIFWEVSDDGATWLPLQVSANTVYLTARAPVPVATANAPAESDLNSAAGPVYTYDSLLAISCDAANGLAGGAVTAQAVRAAIAGAFTIPAHVMNPGMRRLNRGRAGATQLAYWLGGNPAQSVNGNPLQRGGNLFSNPTGSIACGVFADMLIAMWALHGIGDGHRIAVNVNKGLDPVVDDDTVFMVRNWDYNNHGALRTNELTHEVVAALAPPPPANQAARAAGVPGQNQPAPPGAFYNHFIVLDTTNAHYYDPSYGGRNFADAPSWVNASTAGLYDAVLFTAGFVSAMANTVLPNAHVVTFTDQVTNQPVY